MSSTDRNQNADIYQANQSDNTQPAQSENKGLLASVGDTLSHAKDEIAAKFSKNQEAAKKEYHHQRAENADTLVDKAKHKGEELQHDVNKNVESMKDDYHDQSRQVNQDRAMENTKNAEQPKGLIQSAADKLSNMKDQVVSSLSKSMETGTEEYSNQRPNDSSDLAGKNKESEWKNKEQSNIEPRQGNSAEYQRSVEDPQNKGYVQSAMDSLSHMKDEFVASFNKNKDAAKEEYYKQKSENDSNLVDQTKDKAKEWGHGIQKNTEGAKQEFHSQFRGDENRTMGNEQSENKGILQGAADKLSEMKDKVAPSLNKNIESGKEEYYSNKADNSSNIVDQAKNKGKEWEHKANKNVEASKEEFHADS